ncbi:hypothetical protein [Clostridium thermarum]|uniref:hypothetical protein n=1 Tax=Clostridium thermarum TaxID=1716543 RepID=UPI0013CFF736|nr:hypothetical protein [Clostridium thermarum]
MKTYSPRERLITLDLPNLFDFASNDLSQDAFLCWALGWINLNSMSILLWLEKNLALITEKFFESLGNKR